MESLRLHGKLIIYQLSYHAILGSYHVSPTKTDCAAPGPGVGYHTHVHWVIILEMHAQVRGVSMCMCECGAVRGSPCAGAA